MADYAFRHSIGTRQGNELTCNLSGNACLQMSPLAKQLWTDPWHQVLQGIFLGGCLFLTYLM